MRKDEDYVGKRVMEMVVPGRRNRGRPKRRWLDSLKVDPKEKGLEGNEFHDRARWRRLVKTSIPHKGGKRRKEKEEDTWSND